MIPGTYKSCRPINITQIDKNHLKCDCLKFSIVNGYREPLLCSFAVDQPPSHKIYKQPRVKLFKKVNKSVLSHTTIYLEDDDHNPVDFNGETISFTCQLSKNNKTNLKMVRPKNKTEDLLLSITKKCETPIEQVYRKAEETLEVKLTKPRETFSSNPSINLDLDSDWTVRLTSLEVYNSIFDITEENIKFEFYTENFDDFSFTELQDELEENLDISNITFEHLQDEIKGPRIISTYNKLETERRQADVYYMLLMG